MKLRKEFLTETPIRVIPTCFNSGIEAQLPRSSRIKVSREAKTMITKMMRRTMVLAVNTKFTRTARWWYLIAPNKRAPYAIRHKIPSRMSYQAPVHIIPKPPRRPSTAKMRLPVRRGTQQQHLDNIFGLMIL